MLSIDTNILFAAVVAGNAAHPTASAFMTALGTREDVGISEFVLIELYVLLRNPAIVEHPLGPRAAVEVCESFRRHPRWQVLGFPEESRAFHDEFWPRLAVEGFARRRAYDCRLALALLRCGVDEFATVNTKDFLDLGFRRVWNPLIPHGS